MHDYDYRYLRIKHDFDEMQMEKVCRMSDFLEDVSIIPFLTDRLSLYGGTALTFIHFKGFERLSVDIDFNYRHKKEEQDWGEIRNQIDEDIKQILRSEGYKDSDIKIEATYPLGRFTVEYTSHLGSPDNFKIEIGYMRRIPILKADKLYNFHHIGTDSNFRIPSPLKEELFSNKWCTMLYRRSSRDLFDVYKISQEEFDLELFTMTAVIDSLLRGPPKLTEISVQKTIKDIHVDSYLRNVLKKTSSYDFNKIKKIAQDFSQDIMINLTDKETKTLDTFYNEHRLNTALLDESKLLHEELAHHPMILRVLQQL